MVTSTLRGALADQRRGPLVFVWENFGPMHVDRCEAVAEHFAGRRNVIGVEIGGLSNIYAWAAPNVERFRKVTLFPGSSANKISLFRRLHALCKACLSQNQADYFFCHYQSPEVFLTAVLLRLLGRRVYVMNDSKFDDKPRSLWRELAKSIAYLPYHGALVSGKSSRDYLRFLRFAAGQIVTGYDTLSIERIRTLAATASPAAPGHFEARHFTVVARFVPKKNLPTLLEAYAIYVHSVTTPRSLHLCGSGELEAELREQVSRLKLQDLVIFRGFLQSKEIATTLVNSLALILVSIEEQFGLVVIEAQAMGVPVIFTPACGARDQLLRSGVNGFMVEADNPAGMAYFMKLIASDEALWRRLAEGALDAAPLGDVACFVSAVEELSSMHGRN
jgi:glycosyltransferase involved in cell wall biosynthesis